MSAYQKLREAQKHLGLACDILREVCGADSALVEIHTAEMSIARRIREEEVELKAIEWTFHCEVCADDVAVYEVAEFVKCPQCGNEYPAHLDV